MDLVTDVEFILENINNIHKYYFYSKYYNELTNHISEHPPEFIVILIGFKTEGKV